MSSLNLTTSVLIRDAQRRTTGRRGHGHEKTETEIGEMLPPAKGCLQPPKMEEVGNGFSPVASGESPALPTSWFWTSGLQNHQRINFCCFEPLNLWSCVTVAIGNGDTQLQELSLRFSLYSPLLPFLSLSVLVRRRQKAF